MAEAIISVAKKLLISIISQQTETEARVVGDVDEELDNLTNNLPVIQAMLLDAEQQLLKQDVRGRLDELKDTSYDVEDMLDEWNTAIMKSRIVTAPASKKKVHFFSSHACLCFREAIPCPEIAKKIKEMSQKLDDFAKEKDRYNLNVIKAIEKPNQVRSTSLVNEFVVCGRDGDKKNLVDKLLNESGEEKKGLHMISVVGIGGIGKTTLAQLAYNNIKVTNNFDLRIWVQVSNPFDDLKIAKAIIEDIKRSTSVDLKIAKANIEAIEGSTSNLGELEYLLNHIHELIMGKKFLFVLDDVCIDQNYNKWEQFVSCLNNGLDGNKILITTRVASMMGSTDIMTIKELSEKDCWLLFRRLAFFDRSPRECEKLEDIGKKIVGKCKGLPLATKIAGSLMCFKKTREEWQNILDNKIWKEEKFDGIYPPLLLSYHNLPSMLKRCFSYCSIFPKDYKIKKDELIKLWMAQDYLGLEKNEKMEEVGQKYFDHLATRSFFQEFEKDDDGNIVQCKMHDILHEFAHLLSENECLTLEVNGPEVPSGNSSQKEKVRHLMLTLVDEGASLPVSTCNLESLHSLLIESKFLSSYSPSVDFEQTLFGKLTCLRSLKVDISQCSIEEIPKEVGKLLHLRYLKLSDLKIKNLPETLCELYNLQTLDISFCKKLEELPQEMGKLINLRNLINFGTESLSYLPKGIEKLNSLRTLSQFVAGSDVGDNGKACSFECLEDLNHLQGGICIKGLGNVAKFSKARRIQVLKNKNLFSLSMQFDKDEGVEGLNEDDEVLLLEALQPPPSLKTLEICKYRGNTFPFNWISLNSLRELNLSDCKNCKHLPPLGKLSSLKLLAIFNMSSVERVGDEFLGIESDGTSSSLILFPKLESLTFHSMHEWEEWVGIMGKEEEKKDDDVTIMPCLASFRIDSCPKLKALPNTLLRRKPCMKFVYHECAILEERYKKGTEKV